MKDHAVLLFVGGCAQGEKRDVPNEWRECKIPVPKYRRVTNEPLDLRDDTFEVHHYVRERVKFPGPVSEHGMRWVLEVEVMLHDQIPPFSCHDQVRRLLPRDLQTIKAI